MTPMSDGYIALYRCLLKKPIWKTSTPEQKVILVTLLLMANHSEVEWEWQGKKFKAEPGQFVTSLDGIVKQCGKGITTQNVRSALARFEKLDFLTNESTKTGRLVTILNWRTYQVEYPQANKDTNKEVTKTQQRGNKEVTPNNNDNNDNNEIMKKDNIADKPPKVLSELEKAVADFEEMRKKIRKPLTPRAKEIMLKKLKELAKDEKTQIAILEQSIMNSWQGVFPLKDEQRRNAEHPYRRVDHNGNIFLQEDV